jgi:acetoin:2,6-dichlorophenolindophenol oxidoreductase subunit beta
MAETVRNAIKSTILNHLKEKNGIVFGQCLTAVGWVGGTLPELYEEDGMVELSMADVAGGGIVVGAGLTGRRPIYVIRYQGFNWFNSPIIINYACKSKDIWQQTCPIFIRSIAMEGGIGPVAGSSHHSLYYRMPGIKIASPMTPMEYYSIYKNFMENDDVIYVSEHRGSYNNTEELENIYYDEPDIVLFPISITRFEAEKARKILITKGFKASIIHQLWLKPFTFEECWKKNLINSKLGGIVLDDDYEDGIAKCLAHNMMLATNKPVRTMGLKSKTAGFHKDVDNLPPSAADIVEYVLNLKRSTDLYNHIK